MLARLATFNSQPADSEDANVQYLRDTIKSVPGFVAGFHMLDEQSGKAYSLVVLEDEASSARVQAALGERPAERRVGVDPDHVQYLTARAF
ncbi:MAG TPA: hypothetical protein VGF91_04520 [Solirubrobacteraceae bacterium]|jgi:hypothetical protein